MDVFVECGADTNSAKYPFTRKHYLHPSQVVNFRNHYNNIGVYQTVMYYINPVWFMNERGRYVINAKDSLKWGDFYLDFDTEINSEEDYQKVKEDVNVALRYFRTFLNIDIEQVQFFYSGNKGIHLTINANVLGLEPHCALNQIYRDIAKDIEQYCKNKTLDARVYDDKRMFRMINSINKKSGLYKIPLTADEFKTYSHQEIKQLATASRVIEQKPMIVSHKASTTFKRYVEEWSKRVTKQKEFTGRIQELTEKPPCIKEMEERTFRETIDQRNNSGTALASFYYQQNMERDEAIHHMIKWGEENCVPRLNRHEMEIITNSVYNGQYRYGCATFERLSGVCDKDNCPLFNKKKKTENVEE